jgi:hypothetical protein
MFPYLSIKLDFSPPHLDSSILAGHFFLLSLIFIVHFSTIIEMASCGIIEETKSW